MSANANEVPATRLPEAEEMDFEVVDDSAAGAAGAPSLEDFAKMGPELLVGTFRAILKEKLKRWFIRSLIWCTVLLFFAQEHKWAVVVFYIWAFIASIHLAFLLYGWYASGKQVARLAQVFGGLHQRGPN